MGSPLSQRLFARADVTFRLNLAWGGQAPGERAKRWFFELPAARDTPELWAELLHRVFYDSNVHLRSAEPGDSNWLGLERFETGRVDERELLAWDGSPGTTPAAFPWLESHRQVKWEPGPCYYVDEAGRYDVMTANDYTELMLLRLHAAGVVDRDEYVRFLEAYFPNAEKGAAEELWNDRAQRLANLVVIRSQPHLYRRAPGSLPVASGPIDPALVGR